MKRHSGTRSTPAIAVATEAKPGTNFATISERAPQRVKMDSVCRTQESGDNEMRQSVRNTGPPTRRPSEYHAKSAISDAATAVPSNAGSEYPPREASAPVTISVGYAGTGSPACNASTLMKTNANP